MDGRSGIPGDEPLSSNEGSRSGLALPAGKVVELAGPPGMGLTRLGLALLADRTGRGRVAVLDVRGWFCPLAAWESGIDPERLVVVRCGGDLDRWGRAVATLLDGLPAVYAEVPVGVGAGALRRLAARARARGSAAALRPLSGRLPVGMSHLRVEAQAVIWEEPEEGHGRLGRRRLVLRLSGRGVGGRELVVEVEDDGADLVRVVPGLAPAASGSAAG